jgi:CHRD domain
MRFPKRALLLAPVFVLAVVVAALPSVTLGRNNSREFHAKATGYNEIVTNSAGAIVGGAVNTDGFATLKTTLNDAAKTITFRFEFTGLTTNLVQAHYHFSQEHVSGGVMVFLCGPATSPAKQVCPDATHGVVSGTLAAADVIGPVPQNILAGDMAAVFNAIRNDAAYINLHTTMFPGGEIRGQLED